MDNELQRLQKQQATKPTFKGLRLSKKAIAALEEMAYTGMSLHMAADKQGMRRDSLRKTFDRFEVRQVFNQIIAHIRQNAAQDAYLRMVELAQTAKSEAVRADANKWLAGVDAIAPVRKLDARVQHSVQFGGFDYSDIASTDGDAPMEGSPEAASKRSVRH
ncbi:hypothetical protein [Cognatishimia activa]|uniref:Uncharacterized protein n=1 Tax=Cognatishimia activa TaxID=1715691 RepID=A0A975EP14_9RHOB|nr:hypothetical protein [Cognatishimia activa]QTN34671.1 hypothetical protein HZ995_09120 [Cognatishimia activa]